MQEKISNIDVDTLTSNGVPTAGSEIVLDTIETRIECGVARTIANRNWFRGTDPSNASVSGTGVIVVTAGIVVNRTIALRLTISRNTCVVVTKRTGTDDGLARFWIGLTLSSGIAYFRITE
jgi:hypothetical protein